MFVTLHICNKVSKQSFVQNVFSEMQCSDPPVVEDAEYKLHTGVDNFPTIGSSVIYSCKVGYELNDTDISTLHCVLNPGAEDARWKGELPLCKSM